MFSKYVLFWLNIEMEKKELALIVDLVPFSLNPVFSCD